MNKEIKIDELRINQDVWYRGKHERISLLHVNGIGHELIQFYGELRTHSLCKIQSDLSLITKQIIKTIDELEKENVDLRYEVKLLKEQR